MTPICSTSAEVWTFLCGAGTMALLYIVTDIVYRLRSFVIWLVQPKKEVKPRHSKKPAPPPRPAPLPANRS